MACALTIEGVTDPSIERLARRAFMALDKAGLDSVVTELKNGLKKECEAAAAGTPLFGGQAHVGHFIENILYKESRTLTLDDRVRPDGRKFDEIRQITIQLPVFPRLHGSVLFTRGQTQALCTATLGTPGAVPGPRIRCWSSRPPAPPL